MTPETWNSVDRYFEALLLPADPALDAALAASEAAGLPPIAVTPSQGMLLHLLAKTVNARRILELGTLGGYSTIWLARALPPGGRVVTLELEQTHADVAQANFARAQLTDRIELRLGPASQSLHRLIEGGSAPFDLVFIDADKASSAEYFASALALSRPGTVIIVDNVVRKGGVVDAASTDASIRGIRRLNELLAAEGRVESTVVQTVGSKGYDGFILARVKS